MRQEINSIPTTNELLDSSPTQETTKFYQRPIQPQQYNLPLTAPINHTAAQNVKDSQHSIKLNKK